MRDTEQAEEINNHYLLREKSAHIATAARSATFANVLAPLLCIPAFQDEVKSSHLEMWLAYMFIAVLVRTWIIFRLPHKPENIQDPQRDMRMISFAVGIVGAGWGLGWILMAPDLEMVNRMIYVYMTTAAMIASMFAYSVNRATFYAFSLPIMIPSLATVFLAGGIFPWTFWVGLATLYLVVLSIAKSFGNTFNKSVSLRFRNEKLYQELAAERDQSVAANVAKSKFIAIASHDLRQPMHAVNVYLELLNLDNLPPTEKTSLTKIKNSITTLNAMFDSLLNISKLDADVIQVNFREFQLVELADAILDLKEAQAQKKGLAFGVHSDDVVVHGDKLLLQQLIGNLVSNAIQYTQAGSVEVRLTAQQNCLAIDVLDTGCGIPDAEITNIFSHFYRADRTRALHDGLGLGLSIVKRLCDFMGAEIHVTSQEGHGSRFSVITPFVATSRTEDVSMKKLPAQSLQTHRSLQGKCIAVIEDNPIIVEAYRQTLASKGAHVIVLSENEDTFEVQLESIDTIDCILSDYRLSETTGDVLIQKLRDNYNEEIPAIIVTADTTPSHINFFAKLNVQVLHKPISFLEISKVIEKLIGQ